MEVDSMQHLPTRGAKRKDANIVTLAAKRPRLSLSPPSETESTDGSLSLADKSTPNTPTSSLHSRPKRLPCTWLGCKKMFSRPVHLTEHLNSHRGIRPHVCPHEHCAKAFLRKSHLAHHIKNAHTAVRDFVCDWPDCGKAFTTGTRLRRHAASHAERDRFQCSRPGCGQRFRKHATLQRHVITIHEGRAAFVCDFSLPDGPACGAGFATAGKLRAHQGRVHGFARYWCGVCPDKVSFSTYTALQAHNIAEHPPKCSHCGFLAPSPKALRRHLEAEHDEHISGSPSSTFACPHPNCTKTFSKPANLTMHIRTAHEGRRFVCGEIPPSDLNHVQGWDGSDPCGRSFSAKSSLEGHIRAAHLGVTHTRRKEKQSKTKTIVSKEPSTIDAVAGTAYTEISHRFACLVKGCAFRFNRIYDRAVHARVRHGLGETEIAALSALAAVEAAEKDSDEQQAKPATKRGKSKRGQKDATQSSQNPTPTKLGTNSNALVPSELSSDNHDTHSNEPLTIDMESSEEWMSVFERAAVEGGAFWFGGTDLKWEIRSQDDDINQAVFFHGDELTRQGHEDSHQCSQHPESYCCEATALSDLEQEDMWHILHGEEEFEERPASTISDGDIDPSLSGLAS